MATKTLTGICRYVKSDERLAYEAVEESGLFMSREIRDELFPDKKKKARNEKIYSCMYIEANDGKCYLVSHHEDRDCEDGDDVVFETTTKPRGKKLWAKNIKVI